jgi:hypothetical protein
VQLGSIELLYVNAQPLHKVKIIKQIPRRRIMQSVLAWSKGKLALQSFMKVVPQTLLARAWR